MWNYSAPALTEPRALHCQTNSPNTPTHQITTHPSKHHFWHCTFNVALNTITAPKWKACRSARGKWFVSTHAYKLYYIHLCIISVVWYLLAYTSVKHITYSCTHACKNVCIHIHTILFYHYWDVHEMSEGCTYTYWGVQHLLLLTCKSIWFSHCLIFLLVQ